MSPADLRAARKSLGLTQKGLAEALRMGKHGWQTISKWERDDFDGAIPGPVQVALEHLLNCAPASNSRKIPEQAKISQAKTAGKGGK